MQCIDRCKGGEEGRDKNAKRKKQEKKCQPRGRLPLTGARGLFLLVVRIIAYIPTLHLRDVSPCLWLIRTSPSGNIRPARLWASGEKVRFLSGRSGKGWRYCMWAHRLVFGRPSRAVMPLGLYDELHTTSLITCVPVLQSSTGTITTKCRSGAWGGGGRVPPGPPQWMGERITGLVTSPWICTYI